MNHDELAKLAAACGDYESLVLVMGYWGPRWGEASALRVRDVDILRSRIRMERSVAEISGQLTYGSTKTGRVREVVAPLFLRGRLEARMEGKGPDDLLFTSPEGGPLRLSNWRHRCFDKADKSKKLDGLTPHGLRHTSASLAVASGANVKGVQQMLGHQTATMTLDTYADLIDDHLDVVADRLNEAYEQALADSLRTGTDDQNVRQLPVER